jgi:ariadne-1
MCEICYDYPDPDEMQGLGTCPHRFCVGCITEYLNFVITNGQVQVIKCPNQACPCEYNREDIRKFGSKEIYEKYLRFKENIDVNLNPLMKWCPRPDCTHFV